MYLTYKTRENPVGLVADQPEPWTHCCCFWPLTDLGVVLRSFQHWPSGPQLALSLSHLWHLYILAQGFPASEFSFLGSAHMLDRRGQSLGKKRIGKKRADDAERPISRPLSPKSHLTLTNTHWTPGDIDKIQSCKNMSAQKLNFCWINSYTYIVDPTGQWDGDLIWK